LPEERSDRGENTETDSPPEETRADALHRGIRATAGSVPVVGAAAVEVFEEFFPSPINRRTREWLESLASRVRQLEQAHPEISIDELARNPAFQTLVIRSTEVAIRNHQAGKLEALRNAVLNAVLSENIDDAQTEMYMALVDRLTPWHLKILDLFNNPIAWESRNQRNLPRNMMGGREITLLAAFPELEGRRTFYDQIIRDLYSNGLLATDSIRTVVTQAGLLQSITTESGKQFLRFITAPA
jgi:hypothetical protein